MSEHPASQLCRMLPRDSSLSYPTQSAKSGLCGCRVWSHWESSRWDSRKTTQGHGSCSLLWGLYKKSAHGHLQHPTCVTHTTPDCSQLPVCTPEGSSKSKLWQTSVCRPESDHNLSYNTTFEKQKIDSQHSAWCSAGWREGNISLSILPPQGTRNVEQMCP